LTCPFDGWTSSGHGRPRQSGRWPGGLTRAAAPARGARPVESSFLELSTYQNYLGAPLAVAEGKVFMASTDNISGRTLGYAMGLPG